MYGTPLWIAASPSLNLLSISISLVAPCEKQERDQNTGGADPCSNTAIWRSNETHRHL
jgi:hypothetical protein